MLYGPTDTTRQKMEQEAVEAGRSPFRRDYGRLLHSPSFRRLQGKTQLFPGHETDFFRNRLTHSLEVAQIAKGIALRLNATSEAFKADPIDVDLVEFAGLAHDLGHPPFGHNGERALDDCMREFGGFEGNAQTLRILSRVEKKVYVDDGLPDPCGISPSGVDRRLGLNLTYRTMASILKYDEPIPLRRRKGATLKKGYYSSEKELVSDLKKHVGTPSGQGEKFKTIECQIMDIADDIAYSTYDLEDAMKGGFTHPLALLSKFGSQNLLKKLKDKVAQRVQDVTEIDVFSSVTDILQLSDNGTDALSQFAQSKLIAADGKMRAQFSSELIDRFICGVSVKPSMGSDIRFSKIEVERSTLIKIESLKHLNYLLTIMSPRLKVVEYRGYDVVRTIFETLNSDEGHLLLPDDIQGMYERLNNTDEKKRMICDFVSGMTDRYAIEFYSRLRESGPTIFKPL